MSQPTPGPWTVEYGAPESVYAGSGETLIADHLTAANARLIAAAPALLAALEYALPAIAVPKAFEKARAAIAQAKGSD